MKIFPIKLSDLNENNILIYTSFYDSPIFKKQWKLFFRVIKCRSQAYNGPIQIRTKFTQQY
jgi:hypothetical protein